MVSESENDVRREADAGALPPIRTRGVDAGALPPIRTGGAGDPPASAPSSSVFVPVFCGIVVCIVVSIVAMAVLFHRAFTGYEVVVIENLSDIPVKELQIVGCSPSPITIKNLSAGASREIDFGSQWITVSYYWDGIRHEKKGTFYDMWGGGRVEHRIDILPYGDAKIWTP